MLFPIASRSSRTAPARFLLLLVAALLVCAQQAALVHSLGHAFGPRHAPGSAPLAASQSPANGGADEGQGYCEKCFEFAHVVGISFGGPPALAAAAPARHVVAALRHAVPAAHFVQFRSRGPPREL